VSSLARHLACHTCWDAVEVEATAVSESRTAEERVRRAVERHSCSGPVGGRWSSPDLLRRGGPKCLTIATLGAHARVQSCSPAQESKRPSQSDILAGGAKGTRTPDLLVANETRYQLRHSPADRRADQHRDFTTVKPRRTCAFLRLRPPSQSLAPPPERRLSPAPPGSARTPQPDRKDQLCAQSAGPAASKHRSA
jgi:hypothetical protein